MRSGAACCSYRVDPRCLFPSLTRVLEYRADSDVQRLQVLDTNDGDIGKVVDTSTTDGRGHLAPVTIHMSVHPFPRNSGSCVRRLLLFLLACSVENVCESEGVAKHRRLYVERGRARVTNVGTDLELCQPQRTFRNAAVRIREDISTIRHIRQ